MNVIQSFSSGHLSQFVEALNSKMYCWSEEGNGANFFVSFRFA